MSGPSTYNPQTGFEKWLDRRLPLPRLAYDSFVDFPTPKNLNYWYTFGGILTLCLVIQIITGVMLAMHYVASVDMAFASVERIMRDVPNGWLLRYIHAVGASMFFLAVYIHMFRGLYYGSYKEPREVLWILGVIIFFLMIGTAFMGYVLPWGQMSYHGSSVITSLIGAVPGIGPGIQEWFQGAPSIDNATLNRMFSLHYLLPFMIFGVVVLHVWALHVPGNNNPTGVEVRRDTPDHLKADTVPFHPYYTIKDGFALVLFLVMFAVFVFFLPNILGHTDNYIPADPLKTPSHIVPEWYLLPFYAILRAIPDKLGGVIAMFAAIGVLFVVPWLDTSKVKSMRYRPIARQMFLIFAVVCLLLGVGGAQNPDDPVFSLGESNWAVVYERDGESVREVFDTGAAAYDRQQSLAPTVNASFEEVKPPQLTWLWVVRFLTAYYFAYFLVILPLLGVVETPRQRPASIDASVLGKQSRNRGGVGAAAPAE